MPWSPAVLAALTRVLLGKISCKMVGALVHGRGDSRRSWGDPKVLLR